MCYINPKTKQKSYCISGDFTEQRLIFTILGPKELKNVREVCKIIFMYYSICTCINIKGFTTLRKTLLLEL